MKVLIISTSFMEIADSFKESFERAGVQSLLFNTSSITSKSKEKQLALRSKAALDFFHRIEPDFVLDLLGANLNSETIKEINETSVSIKYMLDLIRNYSEIKESILHYNYVFTYESCDLSALKELGCKKVDLLYATYDQRKYYHLEVPKDIDVCFIGQMFTDEQKKRRSILEHLVKDFPNLNFAFYGVYARPYQIYRYFRWMITDNGRAFKNCVIRYNTVNEIYNRSRICVNINSYQTYETWSSRLLEMMGTGSFVITDTTKDIVAKFQNGIGMYSNYTELKGLISKYSANEEERNKVSRIGYQIAKKYTIDNTIVSLIETVSKK